MIESAIFQALFKGVLAYGSLIALVIFVLVFDKFSKFDVWRDYEDATPNARLYFIAGLVCGACFVIGQSVS